jgi:hypothetical protein
MRVGIVNWQVKKSLQPRQLGSFLYSSGGKDPVGSEAEAGVDLAAVSYLPETAQFRLR